MHVELETRFARLRSIIGALLTSDGLLFDRTIHSRLPERHGIYRIYRDDAPKYTLRAGRTKRAGGGLRQRIYRNHLMGDQPGNIRQQLVSAGVVPDLQSAKRFLRERCRVQFHIINDGDDRKWAEYFMLSILRPEHCD